ncbi:terminase family protein [Erysipelotrichaceae bacterium OttesenSCG-928-M19]|nr:terminase family protein [Erysipelotrichaceae bacterium OttesenSCG-928-M19]
MKRHTFKKRQLETFFSMLSFKPFKWQLDAVWQYFKNKLDEVCFIAPRQNGKSQILLLIVLVELFLNEANITFTSHSVESCKDFFEKVKHEINENDDLGYEVQKIINIVGAFEIKLKNGKSIKFRARTKTAGIGGSNDILIFDECQLITDEMMSAIFPTIAAKKDSKVIYAGTSPRISDDDTFFRRLRNTHINTERWVEWGVGSKYSLKELESKNLFLDKKLLKETNPSYGISIDYKTVVREFGTMSNLDYAVQRLGLLHTLEQKALFNSNVINKILINQEEAQKFKGKFILGIKFGLDNHCAVIATKNDSGIYLQVLDKRPNKKGFDWLADFINRNRNRNLRGIMVDGLFKDSFHPMVSKSFNNNYKKISGNEYIACQKILEQEIATARIKIANQSGIKKELLNVSIVDKKDYSKFAPLNKDSDIVVAEAMALANYYVKERLR